MSEYYHLGAGHRPVTTTSSEAQLWFDRGLAWTYGFNHEEAIACYRKALEADPACAMAWWGIAYAAGPNYNKPWEAFDEDDANRSLRTAAEATERAESLSGNATDTEKALIRALHSRYPSPSPAAVPDMCAWNDDYAAAMRIVYARHGEDSDVAALFAEAVMNRTPWALWNLKTGAIAEGAGTAEAIAVLEKAMLRRKDKGEAPHPGLLHMYIHAMEMSPHPERALIACDQLRDLVPDAGHLRHMPTHIDVLCGDYRAVVETNQTAIEADRKFMEREGSLNFYSLYRCHDYHFKIYGAMFLGQLHPALAAAEEMIATLPEELLTVQSPPMADWLEGFVSMKQHVLVRFGQWEAIVRQPLPENRELFCVTTAMMHYATSVAHGALGAVEAAEQQARRFDEALEKVPESRYVFNNRCVDILAIAREMMLGELEYRRGSHETAFTHLRRSVELDDNLPYDEPWGWMQPTRHALAALLLEQGQVEEAVDVYRADLGYDTTLSRACQHPDNVWSLHGYHECLERLGRREEAAMVKQRLQIALARADVPITASCFCRLHAQSG